MKTKQESGKFKSAKLCGCSPFPRSFEGYTSAGMLNWFPSDLVGMLTEHFGYAHEGYYSFRAPSHTVYSFLENFEADTAIMLLGYGFKTVAEASDFLHYCGYGYLGSDENADTVRLACTHGVPVDDYLDIHFNQKLSPGESNYMEDALVFLIGLNSDKHSGGIANSISSDQIKLSHVEEIGYDLISQCVDSEYLSKVLTELRHVGEKFGPDYTTEDVRNLLTKCPDRQAMIRRLKLMCMFDFKTAFDAVHLAYLTNLVGRSRYGFSPELLAYADELFGAMKKNSDKNIGDILTPNVVTPLHEGKVPAGFAAEKLLAGEPVKRIVALSAGVHTSMTEGWL